MEAAASTHEYIWSLNSSAIRSVNLFGLHGAACCGYRSVTVPGSKDRVLCHGTKGRAHCKGLPSNLTGPREFSRTPSCTFQAVQKRLLWTTLTNVDIGWKLVDARHRCCETSCCQI